MTMLSRNKLGVSQTSQSLESRAMLAATGINLNGLGYSPGGEKDLARTGTEWIRGFVDVDQIAAGNKLAANSFKEFNEAQKNYNSILSLKFTTVPQVDNLSAMKKIKDATKKVLDAGFGDAQIVVIGNEPFIDTPKNARNSNMIKFYNQMADFVHGYKAQNANKPDLYIGSITNGADDTVLQKEMIELVNKKNIIKGLDVHLHTKTNKEAEDDLKAITGNLNNDKEIIVTEYSRVWDWKSRLGNSVNPGFASRTDGVNSGTKVFEYLTQARQNPVSRNEWVDFAKSHAWYKDGTENYLEDMDKLFDKYGVSLATYGLGGPPTTASKNSDITTASNPWFLNGIYIDTVEPNPSSGQSQFNYGFIDQFRQLSKT